MRFLSSNGSRRAARCQVSGQKSPTRQNYTQFVAYRTSRWPGGAVHLFVMAATSHDYWLKVLSPPFWKAMHMAIYLAYALIVMHVAMGVMQNNHSLLVPLILLITAGSVVALHVATAVKERSLDKGTASDSEGWISVGTPESILDKRARIVAARRWRAYCCLSRRPDHRRSLERVCASERPGGRRRNHRRLHYLSVAWLAYKLGDGRSPPPFKEELPRFASDCATGLSRFTATPCRRERLPP